MLIPTAQGICPTPPSTRSHVTVLKFPGHEPGFPVKSSGRGLVFYSGSGTILDVSRCLGYLLSKIS